MQAFLKRYAPLALLVALFSEIHFYPLSGTLRLSLGIVLIHLTGLVRDDINLPLLTVVSGLIIGAERYLTQTMILGHTPIESLAFIRPALVYYGCFAALHMIIDIRKHRHHMFRCITVMAFIDALSNSMEALLRSDMNAQLIQIVILAGVLRGLIAYILFAVWEQQSLFIQKQEHQKRYVQLTTLAADVETELFYLRKSADQIESVMRQSYKLYDDLPDEIHSKNDALEIAREIHEIKKDYLRVLSGFDDFIKKLENIDELSLTEILTIVKSSSEKSIIQSGKKIKITLNQSGDVMVKRYLNIFTILNNLIDNSISASGENGSIHVEASVENGQLELKVADNGSGIANGLEEVIFNPGFTTKYDPQTGKASTGIGLSHVKNLVTEMQGQINVHSKKGEGAEFSVLLPLQIDHNDKEVNI